MKMIVGLGNPGAAYAANRHNIGFMLLEAIASGMHEGDGAAGAPAGSWRSKFDAEFLKLRIHGHDLICLKPQSFMNRSGQPVGEAARFFKINPGDILVVHDELDLPPGKLRAKIGGGHAGHNGLRSIIGHIGAKFDRLRVGIGHPGERSAVSNYVLHDFAKADQAWIDALAREVPGAILHWVAGDRGEYLAQIAAINALTSDQAPGSSRSERAEPKPALRVNQPRKSREQESAAASPFERLRDIFKR